MSWITDIFKRKPPPRIERAQDAVTGAPIPPAIPASVSAIEKIKLANDIRKLLNNNTMINKLKSRKLWFTVALTALTTLLNGLGVDQEIIGKLLSFGMSYLAAQGLVDAVAAAKTPKAE